MPEVDRAARGARLDLQAALARCARDRTGVTAIEYAVIGGLIVIAIAALVGNIGTSLKAVFNSLNGHL